MVIFKLLQVGEQVAILLLEILHLAQHNEFFFIDDFFRRLSPLVVICLQLLVVEPQLALVLLPVDFLFEQVDHLLGLVQIVGNGFDIDAIIFRHLT